MQLLGARKRCPPALREALLTAFLSLPQRPPAAAE